MKSDLMFLVSGDYRTIQSSEISRAKYGGGNIVPTIWKFLRQNSSSRGISFLLFVTFGTFSRNFLKTGFSGPPPPPPQVKLGKRGLTSTFRSLKKLRAQLLKSRVFWKCYGRKEGTKEAQNEGVTDLKFLLVSRDFISQIRFVPTPGQIAELMFHSGGHWYLPKVPWQLGQ
jgi:hypothetical protein